MRNNKSIIPSEAVLLKLQCAAFFFEYRVQSVISGPRADYFSHKYSISGNISSTTCAAYCILSGHPEELHAHFRDEIRR